MNTFQILSVIIACAGLLGGIVVVWVKLQIEVAKINTTITFIQKDLDGKEVSMLKIETKNDHDHSLINSKLDKILNK